MNASCPDLDRCNRCVLITLSCDLIMCDGQKKSAFRHLIWRDSCDEELFPNREMRGLTLSYFQDHLHAFRGAHAPSHAVQALTRPIGRSCREGKQNGK